MIGGTQIDDSRCATCEIRRRTANRSTHGDQYYTSEPHGPSGIGTRPSASVARTVSTGPSRPTRSFLLGVLVLATRLLDLGASFAMGAGHLMPPALRPRLRGLEGNPQSLADVGPTARPLDIACTRRVCDGGDARAATLPRLCGSCLETAAGGGFSARRSSGTAASARESPARRQLRRGRATRSAGMTRLPGADTAATLSRRRLLVDALCSESGDCCPTPRSPLRRANRRIGLDHVGGTAVQREVESMPSQSRSP